MITRYLPLTITPKSLIEAASAVSMFIMLIIFRLSVWLFMRNITAKTPVLIFSRTYQVIDLVIRATVTEFEKFGITIEFFW